MLKVLNEINKIEDFLIKNKVVEDYFIALKLDMRVNALIKVKETGLIEYSKFSLNKKINFIEITQEDIEYDPYYKSIFEDKNHIKIDLSLRRRLKTLLDYDKIPVDLPCQVVTFYSYKGGMGRSTTLASFAAHYAINKKKKVVILDFDFEAPGFMNFFGLNAEILSNKSGVSEYILDKEFLQDDIDFEKYYFTVGKEYSEDGDIYIMPAGNLSSENINENSKKSETHLKHYLEALSRLDFANVKSIVQKFADLFNDIYTNLQPDIILIDSRTGFNDIFGLASFYLSSAVVGFFGSSKQNISGIQHFIDTVYRLNKAGQNIPIVLVNSIIPYESFFKVFEEIVDNSIIDIFENEESIPTIKKYPIIREGVLEEIGISEIENAERFISFIKNPSYHYRNFLNGLTERLENEQKITIEKAENVKKQTDSKSEENIIGVKIVGKIDLPQTKNIHEIKANLRKNILKKYYDNKPNLYPEQAIENKPAYLQKTFYFRKCMEDIFNPDKLILLGGKGTGKTYLYKAFGSDLFIKQLKERANKENENYIPIKIIPIDKDKIFETDAHIEISKIEDTDFYFRRFWNIYIWNELNVNFFKKYNFISKIESFKISNKSYIVENFDQIIKNDKKYFQIEKELELFDELLRTKINTKIIILFDQLDFIVKPNDWDKGISPLVKMFRKNPYSRIIPKLFLRRDLYKKLGNITNKNDLKSQTIDLEWSDNEIFAFFFKYIFAYAKDDFFNLMKLYGDYEEELLNRIKNIIGVYNQVPLEEKYIKPLVETFFGKWADMKGTSIFGENYDWFYKNLMNADRTISLRPFIDLINLSVKECLNNIDRHNFGEHSKNKPILSSNYFAKAENRKKAVENHFTDLADEQGNEDLKLIFDYIKSDLTPHLRLLSFDRKTFYTMLGKIVETLKDKLQNKSVEKLKDLLIMNGIVNQYTKPGGYTGYRFALLYKYYLALSNRNNPYFHK